MKLLITEPKDFSVHAMEQLDHHYEVIKLNDLNDIKHKIHDVSILFIRLGIYFDQKLLDGAKSLKVICTPTTGLDHIDMDYCERKGIKVISLKGEQTFLGSIPSTAEHTWTLLQAVNRNLVKAHQHTVDSNWNRDRFKSYNLAGKTLGIIGYGRVGKQVSKYARTFNMEVLAYDIQSKGSDDAVIFVDEVETLFKKADFISLHIPMEKRNFEFIDENLIDQMKKTACIINTSRGKIWDEVAVRNAVVGKRIRGVATDVVYYENTDKVNGSPLFDIDTDHYNCIITPHIAGATYDSMAMTEEFIVQKLIDHVS